MSWLVEIGSEQQTEYSVSAVGRINGNSMNRLFFPLCSMGTRLLSANDPNRIQIILVGKFEGAWRWHCSRRLSPPVLPVNFVGYEYSVSTWIDRISPNVFSSRNNFNNFPEFRWSAIGESPWTRRTADPHRPVLTINFRVHVLGPIGGFSCQIIIGLRKCHKI